MLSWLLCFLRNFTYINWIEHLEAMKGSSLFIPDVDECSENMCAQLCVNFPGGYSCYCDGKKGFKLAQDQKSCEVSFVNPKLLTKLGMVVHVLMQAPGRLRQEDL